MLVYNLVCIRDPISFFIYRACANMKVKGHEVTRREHMALDLHHFNVLQLLFDSFNIITQAVIVQYIKSGSTNGASVVGLIQLLRLTINVNCVYIFSWVQI